MTKALSTSESARAATVQSYINSYLEYRNNFLSIEGYAAYHMFTEHETAILLNKGRVLHQDKFGHH